MVLQARFDTDERPLARSNSTMKRVPRLFLHGLAVPLLCGIQNVCAQPIAARAAWQVSPDGVVWTDDLEVDSSHTTVYVRLRVTFIAPPERAHFGAMFFDATVRSPSPASGDFADRDLPAHVPRWLYYSNPPPIVTGRFGDMLKLDDSRDTLPPGQGPHWIIPSLPFGFLGSSNPADVFQYRLLLDGSVGDRFIDAVFHPSTLPDHMVGLWYLRDDGAWTITPAPTDYYTAVVRIVPAQSALGPLLLGLCLRLGHGKRRATERSIRTGNN